LNQTRWDLNSDYLDRLLAFEIPTHNEAPGIGARTIEVGQGRAQ
jgi:hypothetical protein